MVSHKRLLALSVLRAVRVLSYVENHRLREAQKLMAISITDQLLDEGELHDDSIWAYNYFKERAFR